MKNKLQLKYITFLFIFFFAASVFADPNKALEDISPTHLQLFQLSELTEDDPIFDCYHNNGLKIGKEEAEYQQTIMQKYKAFIEQNHTNADTAQNYVNSARHLMDNIPDLFVPITPSVCSLKHAFVLPEARDIIIRAITAEVQAATEGKVIFWRHEANFGTQDGSKRSVPQKSFSAPGILAGILHDGIEKHLQNDQIRFSGAACTFIYTANVLQDRFLGSKEGYRAMHKKIGDITGDSQQLPKINDSMNFDDENEKWPLLQNLRNFFKKKRDTLDEKTQKLIEAELKHMLVHKSQCLGTLYGVKIDGTYEQNQIKNLCPKMVGPKLSIIGMGEFFHPKFHEDDITNYERVDLLKLE